MRKPEDAAGLWTGSGDRHADVRYGQRRKNFTLFIPSKNKAVRGSNALKKKSVNTLENMRPGFFLDAMLVRGLEPSDLYSVTADSDILADSARKHFVTVPEYVISIMRNRPDSKQLTPVRVITFRRDDLLPYKQDLYDSEGNLETQVTYADYRNFDTVKYPSTIIIKRPLEEYQLVLTVESVQQNMTLTDDQFQIKIPEGTPIQHLE